MNKDRYLATFRTNTHGLASAARRGLEPPVPTCPGWTVADLVGHIGFVDWHWSHHIETRAQEPGNLPKALLEPYPGLLDWLNLSMEGKADPHAAPANLIEWYSDGAARLEHAFHDTDLEETIWHWSGDNRAAVHLQMQAIETAVHRWDAENAHGEVQPIDSDLALDGIDQHFDVMIPSRRSRNEPVGGRGETFHFHRTDGDGEWVIRFQPDDVVITREHDKADVAVRGTASDLFLYLWGRLPAHRLDVVGDITLLNRYTELVPPA